MTHEHGRMDLARRLAMAALVPASAALICAIVIRLEFLNPGLQILGSTRSAPGIFATLAALQALGLLAALWLVLSGSLIRLDLPALLALPLSLFATVSTFAWARPSLGVLAGHPTPRDFAAVVTTAPLLDVVAAWGVLAASVGLFAMLLWRLPWGARGFALSGLLATLLVPILLPEAGALAPTTQWGGSLADTAPIVLLTIAALPGLWAVATGTSFSWIIGWTLAAAFLGMGVLAAQSIYALGANGMPRLYPDYPSFLAPLQLNVTQALTPLPLVLLALALIGLYARDEQPARR
ncbi:MAG: hypothetical protein AAGD12_04850 [Pseudomonadota bacterium]